MSTPRALANQKLYCAKILIASWGEALAKEQIASTVLEQAFGQAVRDHLAAAYGWFLLEVAQPDQVPAAPPRNCSDLPAVAEGCETPPEIREFQQLEREPWLAQILTAVENQTPGHIEAALWTTSPDNLATVQGPGFTPQRAEQVHRRLNELFQRMTDSLDEY